MVKIEASVEINAPLERVWDIVSDLDNEPKFWKGTKKVRNISKEGGGGTGTTTTTAAAAAVTVIRREVTIAFGDQKCIQEVTVRPKTEIRALFTRGVIGGTKTMTLSSKDDGAAATTVLDVAWDVRPTGVMTMGGMFAAVIKRHVKNGTMQAMDSIRREAEGRVSCP